MHDPAICTKFTVTSQYSFPDLSLKPKRGITRTGLEGLSVSANLLGCGAPWGERTDRYSGYELNENYSVNAGFIIDLTERSGLDVSYFFARRTETRGAYYLYRGEGLTEVPDYADGTDYWTYNPNTGDREGIIHTASIDYSLVLAKDAEISVMAAYERSELRRDLSNPSYNYDEASDMVTSIQRHFLQSDDTPLDGFRFHADYQKEFDNSHSFGAGFQPYYLNNRGAFRYDTLFVPTNSWGSFSSLENDFDLTRIIYAAYINYISSAAIN